MVLQPRRVREMASDFIAPFRPLQNSMRFAQTGSDPYETYSKYVEWGRWAPVRAKIASFAEVSIVSLHSSKFHRQVECFLST